MSISPSYSKLLISEEPLQVLPGLATAIGLNEAIVLQQLHYWMNPRRNLGIVREDRRWIYNTYKEWQDNFPFWSLRTIQGIMLKLEREGLIDTTDEFNTDTRDRTKWYTINYGHPDLCVGDANVAHSTSDAILRGGDANVAHSTTKQRLHAETTTETTQETTAPKKSNDAKSRFDAWYATYPRKVGKQSALASFMRHAANVPLDTLLRAVERQKKSSQWQKDGGQFIPNPSTWLNQGRWDDELPAGDSQSQLPVNMRVNNDRELSDEDWLGSYAKKGA